jgi:hypothetical protein
MSPPSLSSLQELDRLDRSSPDYGDQLYGVLCEQEYVQCEEILEHDDLVWLIDYLDEVRCHFALYHSPLNST